MILETKFVNKEEVLESVKNLNNILDLGEFVNKETIILNSIMLLELKVGFHILKREITYFNNNNQIILPFWPINKIVSITEKNIPVNFYKQFNNQIILEDHYINQDIYIIYKTGYNLNFILENIPLEMILEQIIYWYLQGDLNLNSQLNELCKNLQNVYGKGD